MSNWQLLRDKFEVEDDEDIVGDQNLANLSPDLSTSVGTARGVGKARVVVIFIDSRNLPVITSRGSFDLEMIEVIVERDQVGKVIPGTTILLDSVRLQGGEGYRVMVLDELIDAQLFSVRLLNINPPPGAVRMRVYFRELTS